jgi:hypothetical protein
MAFFDNSFLLAGCRSIAAIQGEVMAGTSHQPFTVRSVPRHASQTTVRAKLAEAFSGPHQLVRIAMQLATDRPCQQGTQTHANLPHRTGLAYYPVERQRAVDHESSCGVDCRIKGRGNATDGV